jgi:hypothetical protein
MVSVITGRRECLTGYGLHAIAPLRESQLLRLDPLSLRLLAVPLHLPFVPVNGVELGDQRRDLGRADILRHVAPALPFRITLACLRTASPKARDGLQPIVGGRRDFLLLNRPLEGTENMPNTLVDLISTGARVDERLTDDLQR